MYMNILEAVTRRLVDESQKYSFFGMSIIFSHALIYKIRPRTFQFPTDTRSDTSTVLSSRTPTGTTSL